MDDSMKVQVVDAGKIWNNFHTHTWRCDHAEGDVADYAKRALELGMTGLGISEHAWIPGGGDLFYRMREADVAGYVKACREADERSCDLQVLCGVECDYDPSDERALREYYLEELGIDYLVGSVHELKGRADVLDCFANRHFGLKELRLYTELYVKMLESRLFTFYAHPDLFGRPITIGEDPKGWDENAAAAAREILEAAAETKAVLEVNVSGVWKTRTKGYPEVIYPKREFWEMAADYDIPVIVNTDAHSIDRLDAYVDYGLELVKRCGLRRVELRRMVS